MLPVRSLEKSCHSALSPYYLCLYVSTSAFRLLYSNGYQALSPFFTGLVPSALTEECLSILTSPRTEVSLLILGGHQRGVWCGGNLISGPCPLKASFQWWWFAGHGEGLPRRSHWAIPGHSWPDWHPSWNTAPEKLWGWWPLLWGCRLVHRARNSKEAWCWAGPLCSRPSGPALLSSPSNCFQPRLCLRGISCAGSILGGERWTDAVHKRNILGIFSLKSGWAPGFLPLHPENKKEEQIELRMEQWFGKWKRNLEYGIWGFGTVLGKRKSHEQKFESSELCISKLLRCSYKNHNSSLLCLRLDLLLLNFFNLLFWWLGR